MINDLLASLSGNARQDPAEAIRKAVARGKVDRLDPNTVRDFIALYMVPLKATVQKALLEDPENVEALEGRAAPITAAYLKKLTNKSLQDSDRAFDVIAHALARSNGDDSNYATWLIVRARVTNFMLSRRDKFLSIAKDYLEREKAGCEDQAWLYNFIEVGAIERQGNTFIMKCPAHAGMAARDYLLHHLAGPRRSLTETTSVTID